MTEQIKQQQSCAKVSNAPNLIQSTCAYCGVGCGVDVQLEQGKPMSIKGTPEHPANYGRLCVKGSHLLDTTDATNRLITPEVFGEKVSWDVVTNTVAQHFNRIIEQHGPDSVAFYVSGQLLTEDYYVANKLMKGYIGSANIDTNSRLCMSSAVSAYKRAFGEDIVPCNYQDIEQAELIILIGSNAAWTHPVLYQRIERARQINPNLQLVVIDPRKTPTASSANEHLAIKPGTDAALYNGLLNYLAAHDGIDQTFVDNFTQGFEQALLAAQQWTVEKVANFCGLSTEQVLHFYQSFLNTNHVLSCFTMGINQSSSGVDKCQTIINAHLASGKLLKPGCGPFSLTGQPNAMGGREVGGLANQLAAHMDIDNEQHRAIVQEFWQSPKIATKQGLKAVDLFDKIAQGNVKAVWIMATNPVVSLPNRAKIEQALAKCELVVVSDCAEKTDTLAFADIKLPATTWLEKNGTVTNSERRISRQRSAIAPLGQAKHDWQIICDVAKAMGFQGFNFTSSRDIFVEFAALSGARNDGRRQFDISGLSQLSEQQYDALQPVQWPVAQGKKTLFEDKRFSTPSKKAQFIAITPQLPSQQVSDKYPFVLNSGRLRDQWHTMTRTGKAATLNQHTSKPYLYVNQLDADKLLLVNNEIVEINSANGKAFVQVAIDNGIQQGQLFSSIHWNEQFAANANIAGLYQSIVDPISGQPESKQVAVNINKTTLPFTADIFISQDVIVEKTFWTKSKQANSYHIQIAMEQNIKCPVTFCQELSSIEGEWLSHVQGENTQVICIKDNKLQMVAFLSRQLLTEQNLWADKLFALDALDLAAIKSLLYKESPAKLQSARKVCSCFSITEAEVIDSIEQGKQTVAALGAKLKCGTNCGSCKPELQALIDSHKMTGLDHKQYKTA